jgi:hypothetical protein
MFTYDIQTGIWVGLGDDNDDDDDDDDDDAVS